MGLASASVGSYSPSTETGVATPSFPRDRLTGDLGNVRTNFKGRDLLVVTPFSGVRVDLMRLGGTSQEEAVARG